METPEFVTLDGALMNYFVFGLALVRMSGLVMVAPFFSIQLAALRFRAGMAIFFALAIFPTVKASFAALEYTHLESATMVVLTVQEICIGLMIGFVATIVFAAAKLAGDVAGQQIGFSMAQIMDPASGTENSLVGYLMSEVGTLVFLILNLHLYLIWLLRYSYDIVGIGALKNWAFFDACFAGIELESQEMFVVALKLAIPIITVMLMMSVMIGFITRTMPQMNLMVLDMPLRIIVGLISVMLLIPVFCILYGGSFTPLNAGDNDRGLVHDMLDALFNMVGAMGG
ncbi:MAG: flagellar biosynthetic protein FliR [Planctomycetota bacterium]|jgi:flagellar biosynthetic protein FliR|nr:flagellar biosynthetic protein FliR [Planctomycetota bacterium]